ncbi:hypothetical protein A9P82_04395 [Arachidicoccus ginsenosidimutans]|uniref:DUF1573 domain-containing protein n=1 Tax=Arachidicoccus sp. BS20 TaxID=1850526 RepID=UPI0007F0A14A|nr:DUF1573 domain-containing protein [Arachidicoccus sp. BS20]ANI88594.1 hypothetical protein A9P82_04395 [Arachidicoccus sp. BS20]
MYKIFFLFLTTVCYIGATAQTIKHTPPVNGYKYVHIDDADHDFGNIEYGKTVKYTVKMKNISNDTLALTNVVVSCGCTTPEYKKGSYPPGAEMDITIGFNGYEEGNFQKNLSILFQDNKVGQIVKTLHFKGTGIKKDKDTQ